MNLAIAATGVTFGIVDMGIQALILKTWGHNERKVYLLQQNFAIENISERKFLSEIAR